MWGNGEQMFNQRTLTEGRGSVTVQLVSSFTVLESCKQESMLSFVDSKVIEFKPVKNGDQLSTYTSSYSRVLFQKALWLSILKL